MGGCECVGENVHMCRGGCVHHYKVYYSIHEIVTSTPADSSQSDGVNAAISQSDGVNAAISQIDGVNGAILSQKVYGELSIVMSLVSI